MLLKFKKLLLVLLALQLYKQTIQIALTQGTNAEVPDCRDKKNIAFYFTPSPHQGKERHSAV